jgi:hypothetical protein
MYKKIVNDNFTFLSISAPGYCQKFYEKQGNNIKRLDYLAEVHRVAQSSTLSSDETRHSL